MRKCLLAAGLLIAAPTNVAIAQVGGALDMGQLTGTLSQDHVTQSERARAQGSEADEASSAKARRNCASVPKLKARYGADPRIAKVIQLCRQLGYAVR